VKIVAIMKNQKPESGVEPSSTVVSKKLLMLCEWMLAVHMLR
jgi:hypothetical protein